MCRLRLCRSFFITSGKAGGDVAQGIEAEFAKQIGAESPILRSKMRPKNKKANRTSKQTPPPAAYAKRRRLI
jgi:hypothetical protein